MKEFTFPWLLGWAVVGYATGVTIGVIVALF